MASILKAQIKRLIDEYESGRANRFAQRLEITPTAVHKWLQADEPVLSSKNILKISNLYGITPSELLTGTSTVPEQRITHEVVFSKDIGKDLHLTRDNINIVPIVNWIKSNRLRNINSTSIESWYIVPIANPEKGIRGGAYREGSRFVALWVDEIVMGIHPVLPKGSFITVDMNDREPDKAGGLFLFNKDEITIRKVFKVGSTYVSTLPSPQITIAHEELSGNPKQLFLGRMVSSATFYR
jgi:hypothetical protein